MLSIKVTNGKLEPALKKFKRRVRQTKLLQRIRDKKSYVKPSDKKRIMLQKAKYKLKKNQQYED